MVWCAPVGAWQDAPASIPPQALQTGVVITKVVSVTKPDQSYALYLPTHYAPEKRWPIIYAFDPAARGSMPVELMKDAAERYGYIVVGSNNSRNGDWKPQAEAVQAILQDTHLRLAIDERRIYFAGFSGGARLAASIAQRCKCGAGVLLNGAGFSPSSPPLADGGFALFAAVGTFDFNYSEVVTLDGKLDALRYVHMLRRFDGPHQWAPESVIDEALAWFRLVAMKDGREERDSAFVKLQASEAEKRAKTFQLAGDPYGSWKEYRQAAETFDGLGEAPAFRERAVALEKEKAVRDGAKREQQEFEEQSRLTSDISQELAALRQDSGNHAEMRNQVAQQIFDLRSRTEHEKHPEKLRVLRRALAGIFIEAMESGQQRLEAKDFSHACTYFELGSDADPDAVWALSDLATARALDGDRKGALEALRRAKGKTKDPAAFSAWLREEPAFAKWRDSPEFRGLAATYQESR
jgi:predicted esterase